MQTKKSNVNVTFYMAMVLCNYGSVLKPTLWPQLVK